MKLLIALQWTVFVPLVWVAWLTAIPIGFIVGVFWITGYSGFKSAENMFRECYDNKRRRRS